MARATTDDALQHLARSEKKRLVQGWNATLRQQQQQQQQQEEELRTETLEPERLDQHKSDDDDDDDGDAAEPSDRLAQWLRCEANATPYSACATPLEQDAMDTLEDLDDKLPLTSGQVKRAYRTRARQLEAHETKRAERIRNQRDALLGLRSLGSTAKSQQQQVSGKSTSHEQALVVQREHASPDDVPVAQQPDEQLQEELQQVVDAGVVTFRDLPARQLIVDAAMRNDVLAGIRRELIAGRDVLLVSTGATADATASDERLMMQQLCTQSLMLCVREQELVPARDGHTQHLLLQSRIRSRLV